MNVATSRKTLELALNSMANALRKSVACPRRDGQQSFSFWFDWLEPCSHLTA
jgi:hypothetical protein